MPNRVLIIMEFANLERSVPVPKAEATHVWAEHQRGYGRTRIRLASIHDDGKPRRSGWSVVPDTVSEAA